MLLTTAPACVMRVAFYKDTARLFNQATAWWLSGPYSHCELVIRTDSAGVSLCASSSFRDDGVRLKQIVLDPDHWDFLDVPFDVDEAHVMQWMLLHEDDEYDTLGLAGHVWRRGTGNRRKRICAQAVAEMLGMPDAWRFDPMNFYAALKWLNEVYDPTSITGGH